MNKYTCSMQKKKESLSKRNEAKSVPPQEFWDKFVKDEATDLLEVYEMNDTQGVHGSGEGWEGNDVEVLPNTYSDGTPRDDFGAALSRDFIGNLGYFDSTGIWDGELGFLIHSAFDAASDEYCEDNGLDTVPESGTDGYEDYMDAVEDSLRDTTIVGTATISMRERSFRGVSYTLSAMIVRYADDGDVMGDTLNIDMDLTSDQLTKANAAKFLAEVKKQFETYSFSDGDKEINVEAE